MWEIKERERKTSTNQVVPWAKIFKNYALRSRTKGGTTTSKSGGTRRMHNAVVQRSSIMKMARKRSRTCANRHDQIWKDNTAQWPAACQDSYPSVASTTRVTRLHYLHSKCSRETRHARTSIDFNPHFLLKKYIPISLHFRARAAACCSRVNLNVRSVSTTPAIQLLDVALFLPIVALPLTWQYSIVRKAACYCS